METTSVQFSSVAQLCPTLCDPMNHSTPGLPVHHQLLEFTQTHVHWAYNAIQPSHPLLSPSSPALHFSWYQGLFNWVSFSHQVETTYTSINRWMGEEDIVYIYKTLSIFSCAYWPSVCLLWRNIYLNLCRFLIVVFVLSLLSYLSYLSILEIKLLSVTSFANIFSHSVGFFVFVWLVGFLCWEKTYKFCLGPICFCFHWKTDLRTHWYNLCQRMFCLCSLLVLQCHVLL